jgi:hypothetical protein
MTEQGQGVAQTPYPREPNVHSGGKQEPGSDREKPPYSDRQKDGKSEDELVSERGGTGSSEAGPRIVSDAESGGVSDTDMAPAGPHNVGQSTTTSGEDLAPMSEDAHREDRLNTGVADEDQISGPAMHSGDQGG